MKNMELLGLSVVAAALIMTTGCSSSDDSSSPASGPSAPSEITTPVELNSSSVRNAMALLTSTRFSSSPERSAAFEAKFGSSANTGSKSGTDTYDCEITGTQTDTWSKSWSNSSYSSWGNGDESTSWKSEGSGTTTYNNCTSYSNGTTHDGNSTNIRIRNGSSSYNYVNSFDADTNRSLESNSNSDNYTTSYEDNESAVGYKYTYAQTYSYRSEWSGNDYEWNTHTGVIKDSRNVNGTRQREDLNDTGDVYYGYREVSGDLQLASEYENGVYETSTANGFDTRYDTNTSGEFLTYGSSYSNFKFNLTENGDESNITVSGTLGSTCLGGSVTYATNPVVQENQIDYFAGDGVTNGNSVLPYTGVLTLTGAGSSTITFSHDDANNTSAVISASDGDLTVDTWNDLAIGTCNLK